MPTVTFHSAWSLLLLLPLLAATFWMVRHSRAAQERGRARLCLGVRALLLGLLVVALAEPVIDFPSRALQVLFLLDRSRSISPEQERRQVALVNEVGRRIPSHAKAGVAVFGRDAHLETDLRKPLRLGAIHSVVGRDATDPGAALRLGTAVLSEHASRRLVLISDGNETTGEALAEARTAGADGVQVDVVPIVHDYRREALLEKVVAPERARRGEPLEVRVVARSTAASTGTLRLLHNDRVAAVRSWSLRPGTNVLTLPQSVTASGFHRWEAILETPADTLPENNRALGFTYVRGQPRVLVVEGTPGDGSLLESVLRDRSLEVVRRGASGVPGSLAELQAYDAVVLANVRADQVTVQQMRHLQSGVRDLGIGLAMVGGESAFTAGGWRGTPVEDALPVDMEVERRADEPLVALVLVIDHSGSMGGFFDGDEGKLNYAKRGAQSALAVVRPVDELGVIAFDDFVSWTVPLRPLGNPEEAHRRIAGIQPGTSTRMYPALAAARDALARSKAALKHVVVLTDGHSLPGDFAGIAARLARERVTVSTVGVGRDADGKLLSALAGATGGRYYAAVPAESLPFIFDREAQLAARAALVEETFRPRQAGASDLLEPLSAPPPLRGYVATTAKNGPAIQVPLVSHRGEPIVALRRYGLGRTLAVTTDARARWAAPWVARGDFFSRFWLRTIRSIVRTAPASDLDVTVELEGTSARVAVDAVSPTGEFRNGLDLRARVAGPDGSRTLRLFQTGPGHYEGRFPATERGQYLVAVTGAGASRKAAVGVSVGGVARAYSPEWLRPESNPSQLLSIVEETGGQAWPALGESIHGEMLSRFFRPGPPARSAPYALWPHLLLAGALLLPVDIALRRLSFRRGEFAEAAAPLAAALVQRLPGRRRSQGERDGGTSRLLQAKARSFRQPRAENLTASTPPGAATQSRQERAPAAEDPDVSNSRPSHADEPAPSGDPVPPSEVQTSPEGASEEVEPAPGGFSGRLLAAKRRAGAGRQGDDLPRKDGGS